MECDLYHHGIKGMKWGVRRFRKKDGGLTSAGKKRYDDGEKRSSDKKPKEKSKHRQGLEEYYQSKGLSKKQSEAMASKRIKTEKVLAIVGGVTIAAATAYALNSHTKNKADGIIKATSKLQRIEMTSEGKLHDAFYVAENKADKDLYRGKLGLARSRQTGQAHVMKIGVKNDIKVAGKDTAVNTFKNLYENNSEFRNHASQLVEVNVHRQNPIRNSKDYARMYENFNSNLVKRTNPAVKQFYSTLQENGYGAIRDVNDMKFSGYKAKNPLIVFGQSDNVAVESFKKLSDKEIQDGLVKDSARKAASYLAKFGGTTAAVGAGAMIYDDSYYISQTKKNQNSKNKNKHN